MKIVRLKNGRIDKAGTIYQTALEIEGVFTLDDLKARLGRLVSMDNLMYIWATCRGEDIVYIGWGLYLNKTRPFPISHLVPCPYLLGVCFSHTNRGHIYHLGDGSFMTVCRVTQ